MSWQPCWIPAMRYGTNLCIEPLSCTDPDTPWATLTRSPSLEPQRKCIHVSVTVIFYELMPLKGHSTWNSASDYYFFPWHPRSPSLCTFSDARHQKKNIPPELRWSRRARTPSWLGGDNKEDMSQRRAKLSDYKHSDDPNIVIPVDAPRARAFTTCPTVWIPPSAITGTPNRRAYSATLYTDVPWGRPHAITAH